MKELLINKLFKFSNEPVKFLDLIEANSLYNEGMLIDPAKLHFKFNYFNTYFIYFILCLIVLTPLTIATHFLFEKIDFHFSLISAVFVTSAIFICFDIFKIYTRKIASLRQIKAAWQIHLSHFEYEKYNAIVVEIYNKANELSIPKTKLEQYILENLVKRG
ncbi:MULTISPECIES: hypothetical protein [unclassified Campylobacter]|uniref:hypothetical protein n=1 Tax=unclassified Campylobacter TaxID=2593542 RepID=UPI001BDA7AAB|nr:MULTISPECIES: hypothetical protein [unclassified Campylobacter]MBZ7976957.1 hypothetical protein [Campylobacter sp. RM12637]MBZ7978734.1 hypothetical protein [Campylobacter sp. RM12654]MBZ7980181.1 hypothetical protein [Campylobacter sp. RM12642]MBZ7982022.1 hypothetical protein [Campylobacter sp. RM12640]MBZ7984054.1 hypothetical protein [Campylobacter sp. RM12647]MBZ7989850.1 hypothetical protein [Campylobacter sp. RM12635]MBZ7991677.1 hypothetical protein [Campylobacter sp. RM9331]MBZ